MPTTLKRFGKLLFLGLFVRDLALLTSDIGPGPVTDGFLDTVARSAPVIDSLTARNKHSDYWDECDDCDGDESGEYQLACSILPRTPPLRLTN